MKVVSNHLANAYGTGDRRGQWSVLSRLAADCRVVFFQLHIGRALFAQPNLDTALHNLGPHTIQGTIPVAPIVVFVLGNGPGGMGQRFERARYLYINPERLTTEPALDEIASRPGIGCNRNKTLFTHDCSFAITISITLGPRFSGSGDIGSAGAARVPFRKFASKLSWSS